LCASIQTKSTSTTQTSSIRCIRLQEGRQTSPCLSDRDQEVGINGPKILFRANDLLSPAPNSIIATVGHDVHRMRRNSINGFFSNASIRRVEPIIKERLEKMLSRWSEASPEDGKILYLHTVFKAYASDIITTYAFGDCFHFLDEDDWGMAYFDSTEKYFGLTHVFGHFPVVMKLVNNAPTWALRLIIDNLSEMSEKQEVRAPTFISLHNFIPCLFQSDWIRPQENVFF